MAVDFSKVPVGTKVETAYGPGEIVTVNNPNEIYPVSVRCDSGEIRTYTRDGRYQKSDTHPTLFLAPFEWPEQEQPLPDLAIDTPVMVQICGGIGWHRRHFCRWEDGRCVTFENGFTSFTSKGKTFVWDEWRLPTEEELKGNGNVE